METETAPVLSANWQDNSIPSLEDPEDKIRNYMLRMMNPLSPRRRWHTLKAAHRSWMYMGNQWIEPNWGLAPGNGAYHFFGVHKRDTLAAFKRPVMNITRVAVRNEVARLGKKEYVPDVLASRNVPTWVAAARAAKDILVSEAYRLAWGEKREQAIFNFVVDGTLIVKTYWDEVQTQTVTIGSPDAVSCPQCNFLLASDVVPASFLADGFPGPAGQMVPIARPDTVERPEPVPGMTAATVRLHTCPLCGQPVQKYDVSEDEAAQRKDSIGNPLGMPVPKGDSALDVVSMHEYYPENGGVHKDPYNAKVHHQLSVMSIEDILERWGDDLDEDPNAEDPSTLIRLDPLFSDPALLQKPSVYQSVGNEVFAAHARVWETVVKPQPGVPGKEFGAHFIRIANQNQVISRPLCVPATDENGKEVLVPRVEYHVARYWKVPGHFFGTSFVEDLIPTNRRINEIIAQGMDLRERGKPSVWVPEGVEITLRDDKEGSLQVMEYDTGEHPEWNPRDGFQPVPALTASPYYQEYQQCLADAQLLGAPQDIEMGQPAGSVKTTSGLMLMSDQAQEKRGPMERGLVGVYESVFQHLLIMTKTFRQEEAAYEVRNDSGIFEEKSFRAETLQGARRVRVTTKQGVDQRLFLKEATAEAIEMQLYQINTPLAREQLLENMSLPKIDEKQSVQIERAEMAWSDFVQTGAVPIIDTLFDPAVWYAVLGVAWLEDEAYSMQQAVGFPSVMAALDGWEDTFTQMQQTDQAQRSIYSSQPPEAWQGIYNQLEQIRKAANAHAQKAAQLAMQAGQPPAAPPQQIPPTPPPPQNGFLPKPLQQRILACWMKILGPQFGDARLAVAVSQQVGVPLAPEGARIQKLMPLLQMRAVIEAFRILAQEQQAAAAPPAPGPPQTNAAPPPPQ